MNTINKTKLELLKKLKQRLEDSWSGFAQVIEEAEEFIEDVQEAENKEQIDYAEVEDSVDQIIGIVHSHPQDILEFSESDKYSCKSIDLTFYLVSPKSDKIAVIRPDEIDA